MANTYTWFGGSGFGNVGTNWSPAGPPGPGAVAVANAGTVILVNSVLTDNVVELNAGTFQITNSTGSFFTGGGSTIVSGFDNETTLIGGTNGPAALDAFGDSVNEGTIEAVANALTIAISAYVTTGVSLAGTLLNDGLISVVNGATLDIKGSGANALDGGDVAVQNGTAVVTAADIGSDFSLAGTATLDLDSVTSNASVIFSGTTNLLAFNATALDSTITISGFGSGDTVDIGAQAIGTIVYQDGGSGTPILTVIGTNGATLLSDPFSNASGGLVGSNSGTFVPSTLASGTVAAGPFELITAGNGDTLLELLPPSIWVWTDADPGNNNDPSNWSLVSGPGNQQGTPNEGDTIIANNATLAFPLDNTFNGNTIYLTGTSEMSFAGTQAVAGSGGTGGKPGISYQNPTVDGTSVISNDPAPPATTTLNFAGYNVNDGTLISNGGPGSTMTINVTQDGTAPGYLINYGDIEANTGNTVTISAAGTSVLFNAGLIYANHGTVIIGGNGIAGGYAPMLGGVALIGESGTIQVNTGFPSGTQGSLPTFAFYDGDSGDMLILDDIDQFGGRILGFQQGDTINLGSDLAISKIAVTADGRVLLENNKGAALDTLVLSSGAYNTGTFTVTTPTAGTQVADGFTLTTGGDGDSLLTTDVVDSAWNNASGTWQTAAGWSTGIVPGSTATAVIGVSTTVAATGSISPFVLTTGNVAVDVNSLTEVNANATLQITSATTVGTSTDEYGISQIAGEIEVTGGNTLTSTYLQQMSPTADLQIDPGGVLTITGHTNPGFANLGTIAANGNTIGVVVQGTATVNDGVIKAGPVLSGTNVVSTGGFISIGQDGGGTPAAMTVENGATVSDTYGFLGSDPTSFGSLTVTGAGTTWDDEGDPTNSSAPGGMIVGDDDQAGNGPSLSPADTAQLVVSDYATLNEATFAEIGATADSAGSVTIATDGVWNIGTAGTGTLDVGVAGSGTLTVQGGGTLDLAGSGLFEIGQDSGGTGTVTINGGTLTAGSGAVVLGNASGSSGALTVENDGLLVAGSITVGSGGSGSLTVGSGGTVQAAGVTVGSGSTISLSGGVLDPVIPIGVNGSGVIQGYGTLAGNVSLNASSAEIIATGGTLQVTGSITGAGTLDLAGGSGMRLDLAPSGVQSAYFAPGTETLILSDAALNQVAFANVTIGSGDLIDFGNSITIDGISYASGANGQNVTLDVAEGVTSGTIVLDNVTFNNEAAYFNVVTDPTTGDAAVQAAPCFAAGTRIMTARGEMAVEALRVGDVVRTVLGEGAAPIIWVGRREVDCASHATPRTAWPVRVAAGAFGPGQPHSTLWLSPDHAVYVEGVLIPVKHLVNGSTIAQVAVSSVTYYHIELAAHDVVLAEGLPVESFLDIKDGSNYAKLAGPVRLFPYHSARMWEAFGCAPLIVTGPELEAARAVVASFAATQAAA